MSHSLRAKIKGLRYKGIITDKDCNQLRKALDNEDVLDKIRAEIMQLDYDIESVDYDSNDMPQTEIVHTICREEVLHIIAKYKDESEVEDADKCTYEETGCGSCKMQLNCQKQSQESEDKE